MKYVCRICGYVYDEETEGTPFSALPSDWKCPLCGAARSDFRAEEDKTAVPSSAGAGYAQTGSEEKSTEDRGKKGADGHEGEYKELSYGQLFAVFSNLARGCEKQYRQNESKMFAELADYFDKRTPAADTADTAALSAELIKDAERYTQLRAVADEHADRGAERVCVWGEKVTAMLSSLLKRYVEEGEDMLSGTGIWVCSVCGFVYIGDAPPALCPVCKVPEWKFEKERMAAK